MSKKDVDDYLNDGVYGVKLPMQEERNRFLGTLQERIVICLTVDQIMQELGQPQLKIAMENNPNAKLLINGHVPYRFFNDIKALAKHQNIPYTSITNEEHETDIGLVLTYDQAVDTENIFVDTDEKIAKTEVHQQESSLFGKLKSWFK